MITLCRFQTLCLQRSQAPRSLRFTRCAFVANREQDDRKIIFVAHGIAGYIVKETLARNGDYSTQVRDRTIGILFLGLPEFRDQSQWNDFRGTFLKNTTKIITQDHSTKDMVKLASKRLTLWSHGLRRSFQSDFAGFALLQVVEKNFGTVLSSDYAPLVEHIQTLDEDVGALTSPSGVSAKFAQSSMPRRPTDFSSSTGSSRELDPQELVKLSLFDIKPGDESEKEIWRLLRSFMARQDQDETLSRVPHRQISQGVSGKSLAEHSRTAIGIDTQHEKYELSKTNDIGMDGQQERYELSNTSDIDEKSPINAPRSLPEGRGPSWNYLHTQPSPAMNRSVLAHLQRTSRYVDSQDKIVNQVTEPDQIIGIDQQVEGLHTSDPVSSGARESKATPKALSRIDSIVDRQLPTEKSKHELADKFNQFGDLQRAKALYLETKSLIEKRRKKDETGKLEGVYIRTGVLLDPQTDRIIKIDCRVAEITFHEGKYEVAEDEFERLENFAKQLYSENHIRLWDIRRCLAVTLDKRGKYEKAQEMLNNIERGMENIDMLEAGANLEEHRTIAVLTKSTLSLVLGHLGDFPKAIEVSDEALKLAHRLLQGSRGNSIRFNRAAIYTYHERYKEAKNETQEVLANMEKNLGPKHLKTLDCSSLQAHLFAVNGDTEQAEKTCERALQGLRTELGVNHPVTLQALETLVNIFRARARLTDALHTAKDLVQRCRLSAALGHYHPQTISAESALASVYSARGELQMAFDLQFEVIKKSEDSEGLLGLDHPITLRYRSDLAAMYSLLGNWASANATAHEVFARQCENFVREHQKATKHEQRAITPAVSDEVLHKLRSNNMEHFLDQLGECRDATIPLSLLSTMHCLGISEREIGYLDTAERILKHVVHLRNSQFTKLHADALSSRFELAKTKRALGNLSEAAEDLERVLDARTDLLGPDHPDTLNTKHELYLTEYHLNQDWKLVQKLHAVLSLRIQLLGGHHPDIVRSQFDLANLHHSQGNLERAEELQIAALSSHILTYASLHLENMRREDVVLWSKAIRAAQLPMPALEEDRRYGNINPSVVLKFATLASICTDCAFHYGGKEKLDKAIDIQYQVFELQSRYSGETASSTIQTAISLALLLQMRRSPSDIEKALEFYKKIEAATHDNPLLSFTSKNNLAALYFAQGKVKEAAVTLKDVLKTQRQSEADPQELIETMTNLAYTHKELKETDEANKLLDEVEKLLADGVQFPENPQIISIMESLRQWRNGAEAEPTREVRGG